MRLVSRNDVFLLGGLAIALFVLLSGPLGRALDMAHEIDRNRGLQLLPALVILAAVFMLHLQRKRHQMRATAIAAAAEARQAGVRAGEMERLVGLGQALAGSLDLDAIRAAATQQLPLLVPGRVTWNMLPPTARQAPPERDQADGERFPMMIAGQLVGVVRVMPDRPLTEHQRSVLTAAAAMLAASVKNAELFRELRDNSVRDALTGCVNRKQALEVIDAELRRARRSKLPISLAMFDLDHFKGINDRHGHLCGDAVLAEVGQRMNAVLRGSDVKCRYGGEEFLILLPDTPLSGARRVADTLRRELEAHAVIWSDDVVRLTASFGVAEALAGELDVLALIGRADAALYRAKQDGRNCVRVSEEPERSDAIV